MKKLITFIFLSSIAISSIAQSDTSYYTNPNKWSATKPNRVNAAVSLGGGVSFFNSKYASTYTFIAPSIKYRVSPKFAVCAGLIHYNLTGNRFITGGITDNNYLNRNTSFTGNIIQVGGMYELNNRLTLSGSVLYQAPSFTNRNQKSMNATSLGLEYKVNPSTTISIQTNISQGNTLNPYYNNPIGPN